MRNIGIIFILVLFGMTLWKAYDRNQPASPVTAVVKSSQQVAESAPPNGIKKAPEPGLVEEAPTPTEEAEPAVITDEPVVEKSSSSAVKLPQEYTPPAQNKKTFNRLVIPSLKLNVDIVSKPYKDLSWDLTTLGQDIAQLDDIPNQTTDNNIVLAGHVTVYDGSHGPFRYLWRLNPGDTVMLNDDDHIYTYTVREQLLVYPDEAAIMADSTKPQLTLITCTTWNEETLSYLRRRVILADLEKVEAREVRLQ